MSSILGINNNHFNFSRGGDYYSRNAGNRQNTQNAQNYIQQSVSSMFNQLTNIRNNPVAISETGGRLNFNNSQSSGQQIEQRGNSTSISAYNASSTNIWQSGGTASIKAAGFNLSSRNATTSLSETNYNAASFHISPHNMVLSLYSSSSLSFSAQGGSVNLRA